MEIYKEGISSLPIEYYEVIWMSFAREKITPRTIDIKSCLIDSSNYRFSNGSDIYISRIIKNILENRHIVGISKAHRLMKESFNNDKFIQEVNSKLKDSINLKDKNIGLSVDLRTKNSWENSLITELDEIPYINIGKENQCIMKTQLALSNKKVKIVKLY